MNVKSLSLLLCLLTSACSGNSNSKGTSGGDPELHVQDGSAQSGFPISSFGGNFDVKFCVISIRAKILGEASTYFYTDVPLPHPTFVNVTASGGFLSTTVIPGENRNIQNLIALDFMLGPNCGPNTGFFNSISVFNHFSQLTISSSAQNISIQYERNSTQPLDTIGHLSFDSSNFENHFLSMGTEGDLLNILTSVAGLFYLI